MTMIRAGLLLLSCLASAACAADDPGAGGEIVVALKDGLPGLEDLEAAPGEGEAPQQRRLQGCSDAQWDLAWDHASEHHSGSRVMSCTYNSDTNTIVYTYGPYQDCGGRCVGA